MLMGDFLSLAQLGLPGIRAALAQELVIPPRITAEMAKGFTLDMVKANMNSRADEVFELARTNLWR